MPLRNAKIPDALALRRGHEITVFQRFMDNSTSAWRYRVVSVCAGPEGPFLDLTGFRRKSPASFKSSFQALKRVEKAYPDASLFSLSEGQAEPDHATVLLLNLYTEFFRFYHVNRLIVGGLFAGPLPDPVDFRQVIPIYNLILSLDMLDYARLAVDRHAARLMALAGAAEFRDDANTNAAGTMRSLADMYRRFGEREAELAALSLSQDLSAKPGRAARLAVLLAECGQTKRARDVLSKAREKWPNDARLKDIDIDAHTSS